jgi:O-antigen polymerase
MLKTNLFLIDFSRICLVFIVFSLFLVLPHIDISGYVLDTVTSKLIYFLYGCVALLGFYTLYVVSTKTTTIAISRFDLALFALVFYIVINRYAIQPYFGFSIRYIELMGLSFLYLVLRCLSAKNYSWLLLAIIISGIVQAVYGNLQLLGFYASNHSGFKMTGSFFNPGPYAGFLVSVLPIALGMYLYKETLTAQVQAQAKNNSSLLHAFIKHAFEYIPLLGIVTIVIVLPATQSRAAWLAAIGSSLAIVAFRYAVLTRLFKKINAVKKTVIIVLSAGIVIVGLFGMYQFKKGSSNGRAFIWKVTTEMIADTPVFGVGFDRFNAHYMNYQAQYFAANGETTEVMVADNSGCAFNEWLQFVAENGLLGLVFLAIAVFVLLKTTTARPFEGDIVKTGLLAIGVFACFSYPMQILPIKLVLLFLLAMLANSDSKPYLLKTSTDHNKQWLYKTLILLLGFVGMTNALSYTRKLDSGFVTWQNALNSHQYGDYKRAIQEYESVYSIFRKNGDFLMNYGKTLTMSGDYFKAIEVLEQVKHFLNTTVIATALGDSYKAIKQYDKAAIVYQQAANMTPCQFYPNYLLAQLYDEWGQKEKAIVLAEKILNKKIKVPSTAINEIRQKMQEIVTKYKNPPGFKN